MLIGQAVGGYMGRKFRYRPALTERRHERSSAVRAEVFQKRVWTRGGVSAGPPDELDTYVRNEQTLSKKIAAENKITAD